MRRPVSTNRDRQKVLFNLTAQQVLANERIRIAAPDLLYALKIAEQAIETHGFAGEDQNPLGVRHVINAALAKVEAPK